MNITWCNCCLCEFTRFFGATLHSASNDMKGMCPKKHLIEFVLIFTHDVGGRGEGLLM